MAAMIRTYALMGLIALVAMVACSRRSGEQARLDAAERVMVAHPDSALAIIDSIDASALRSDRERARYALLKSMAIDKNYVDTTTFDILQPAIDYYPRHGSPDERLRTYYYQGRIYQNRHEYDSAMVCFIRGKEYSPQATDTLTAANLLVAQGMLMYESNIFEDYIDLNLIAAKMYHEIGRTDNEVTSLNNAMLGTIILSEEQRADSILSTLEQIVDQNKKFSQTVASTVFRYIAFYGDKEEVFDVIGCYEPEDIDNDDMLVDIAHAYHRFGDAKNAMRFLEATSPEYKHELRYKTSKAVMYDISDDIAEAFKAYREATVANDSINKEKFYNDLLFLQERYAIEKAKMDEIRSRDRLVWASLCIALALLIVVGVVYYRYRISRSRSILQQSENERLKLERNAKALEAENLAHRVELLESESASLKEVLASRSDLGEPVMAAVNARLEMLNAMLVSMINDTSAVGSNSFVKWREKLLRDKDEFMNSTRRAFEATNPKFIEVLVQHGLTVDEINYACLYAIGLRGAEVGEFLQTKNHYRINSKIRKKLNLGPRQTNLGTFIRNLLKQPQ